MEQGVFEEEARQEAEHWWFVGRRKLFRAEIERLGLPRTGAVLDVGSGTGANLRLLKSLGFNKVSGIDFSPLAQRYCAEKGLGDIQVGDMRHLPFADAMFDLVMATDVIEHVDEDDQALREIHRVLRPGGYALITVPTFPSLWGLQDDVSQHKRRYLREELVGKVEQAGFTVKSNYYFNFFLFVPIYIARQVVRWFRIPLKSEAQVNSPLLNRVFLAIFRADIALAPRLKPPFGVSALAMVQRRT